MESQLSKIFTDKKLIERIKKKLPHLFNIAELESSRAGKIGMEVGSAREKILIALLIYKFGKENLETEIPITMSEVDVIFFRQSISIKTITSYSGVKVIWTIDAQKAFEFYNTYQPKCEMLLTQLRWDLKEKNIKKGAHPGGLFYVPLQVQKEVLADIGKDKYLKLPKRGTNPRGVEISSLALRKLLNHKDTKCIKIIWKRSQITYDPYKRWVDYWKE
jgi:hypothetical protein